METSDYGELLRGDDTVHSPRGIVAGSARTIRAVGLKRPPRFLPFTRVKDLLVCP